jgi:hypothetical protein
VLFLVKKGKKATSSALFQRKMDLKKLRTITRKRALMMNRTTNASTKSQNKLMKILSTLNASHKAISPAKKTKNGFLSKSFMHRLIVSIDSIF